MASIFTYNDASRVSSPWSTPGSSTPQVLEKCPSPRQPPGQTPLRLGVSPISLKEAGITRLEPEPQDGSTEYKLHLLLRPRRKYNWTSTGSLLSGSQHSKTLLSSGGPRDVEAALMRPSFVPSTQTRQIRLQQLTTQLLWRLQQSSPFHSSSVANLVLPLLPEAAPKLGLPNWPATVLPGLEESQGALYEIGVADDGTLVGLTEEELDESLTNLKAMAASLGCVVELQRKVVVGECEWTVSDSATAAVKSHSGNLWVAEALVRPDMNLSELEFPANLSASGKAQNFVGIDEAPLSDTEQLRVTITGSSTSGKSSLLGVLTTSSLDNGRGKSRLSLLKHRHEIASGITSSVAQELIGYSSGDFTESSLVVNYSSKDVSSWVDVHTLARRLVFLSDSPGLSRYAKSTFRTLLSWRPHWTVACVAADADGINTDPHSAGSSANGEDSDSAFTHVHLCLKLGLPLIVAITKMDLATKTVLRTILAKLLSILKCAGKKPVLLSNTATGGLGDTSIDLQHVLVSDDNEVEQHINSNENTLRNLVPLVFTSAVTGAGLGKVHALLNTLPYPEDPLAHTAIADSPQLSALHSAPSKLFHIDEVFMIPPSKVYSHTESSTRTQGIVLCGYVNGGTISIGDEMLLGPFSKDARLDTGKFRRSSSYNSGSGSASASKSLHAEFAKSLQLDTADTMASESASADAFTIVRVVSLRNLRLPVRSLLAGQVGTIGINSLGASRIQRTRKGMVLAVMHGSHAIKNELVGYRTFTASFTASDFASTSSPPLILAGHALVYFNSVRAAVKVMAVALGESEDDPDLLEPGSPVGEVFAFDSDGVEGHTANGSKGEEQAAEKWKEIKIKFRFVSSVEWMQVGDKVLVVPTASAAGPVAGPVVPTSGLTGFVGRISNLADSF